MSIRKFKLRKFKPSPPCSKSAEKRLEPVTRQWISPPRRIYSEQTDEIFLGTYQRSDRNGGTVATSSLARKLIINNSTPHVFINVISPHHSFYLKRCHFLKHSASTKKEQLIFTLATIKVEVQLKTHALWSRTKFKTTKILSCMFSFIYTKICTNENFPLYGIYFV